MNPRIDNELIKPYRNKIRNNFTQAYIKKARKKPQIIGEWINKNIQINSNANYYDTPITPSGVIELGIADSRSANIFSVALYRSLGIPARLQPGTKIPQYYLSGKWLPAFPKRNKNDTGAVQLTSMSKKKSPAYYKNFTLAKLDNGFYKTLEYEYGKKLSSFDKDLKLESGHYLLITGNRLQNDKILTRLRFFNLGKMDKIDIPVHIRENKKL